MKRRRCLRVRFAASAVLPTLGVIAAAASAAGIGGPGAHSSPLPRGPAAAPLSRSPVKSPLPDGDRVLKVHAASEFGFAHGNLTALPPRPMLRAADQPAVADTSPSNVTLDGTLGNSNPGAVTPANGTYTITPADGKQVGGNLFFSFDIFNLDKGAIASFTGPATTQSILARVTGPLPSNIDGTLQCTVPRAVLYLINPNGVIFGADAVLDLQGPFAVTTAEYVRLGTSGNGSFDAANPSASALTTAAPAAFGFTAQSAPAAIAFNGSQLGVPAGTTLAVAAGNVSLTGATLQASGGRISIASLTGAGEVSIDPSTLDLTAPTPAPGFGAVSLTANSLLSADGPSGGAIHITAGSLVLDNSSISSTTTGAGPGLPITISLTGPLTVTDGAISADTSGPGAGGGVRVSAGDVTLTDVNAAFAGISGDSLSSSGAAGPAGGVSLSATSLTMTNGALIDGRSFGVGNGGNLNITVSGAAMLSGENAQGVDSAIDASCRASNISGNSGNVTLSAGSLQLLSGALLSGTNLGLGNAGNVKVKVAGAAIFSGADAQNGDAGIYDSSFGSGSGRGGNVTLSAASLQMLGGALIFSTNLGSGAGGNITVNVPGQVLFSGADPSNSDSGIYAVSNGPGSGAAVTVTAGSLQLLGGAAIISTGLGSGPGGNITVSVSGPAMLSGADPTNTDSGIYSNSIGSGNGGSVTLSAGSLQTLGGAGIVSSAAGSGPGGNVVVNVSGQVQLSGADPANSDSGIFAVSNSGAVGNAGMVTLSAGSLQLLGGAGISSSTSSSGSSGNVTINVSGQVLLSGADPANNDSGIAANAHPGATGNAGSIALNAGGLQVLGGASIDASTFGPGSRGNIVVNVSGQVTLSGADSAGNDSGIYANSNAGATGNAGSIALNAASLQVLGGAGISSSTFGPGSGGNIAVNVPGQVLLSGTDSANSASGILADSNGSGPGGNAGSVMLTAGSLQMLGGANISSSTLGLGNAGKVTLSVAGQAMFSGVDAADGKSGVFSITGNPKAIGVAGGDGGDITLSAESLQVLNGALVTTQAFSAGKAGTVLINAGSLTIAGGGSYIDSDTYGPGSAGGVTVDVTGAATLDGAGTAAFTGISSNTNATGRGGSAGPVTLSAASLQVLAGANISSSTYGLGNAGAVVVDVAGAVTADGAGALHSFTGFATSTNATGTSGDAGSISLTAGSLQLLRGAFVDSSTFGSGSGGSVTVDVSGQALFSGINGYGNNSGVYSSAEASATGNAAGVSVDARSLEITNFGVISCATMGPGNGGNVIVDATKSLRIFGAGQPGIFAASYDTTAGGDGGTINVKAASLAVSGTGMISAETQGAGAARSVTIDAGSASFTGPQVTVDCRSTGKEKAGPAGSVTIAVRSRLVVDQASLEVDAGTAQGGDLEVTGPDLTFYGGSLLASSGAGFGGGNLRLKASGQALLLGTRLSATGGGNGGSITIDPLLVTLDRAALNADGGANGGNITIQSALLLNSESLLTATGNTGIPGNVVLAPPDVSLAGSLVALPGSLALPGATLAQECAQRLGAADVSSFLITGNGGTAPAPPGWQPDNIDDRK